MYKSANIYKSISLNKDDLVKVEELLKNKFPDSSKFIIRITTHTRELSLDSFYELNDEEQLKNLSAISISIYNYQDSNYERYTNVLISTIDVTIRVQGLDEVWVNGMAQIFKDFFKERRSVIAMLSNLIPYVAGGLMGLNLPIFVMAIMKDQTLKSIWTGLLLVIVYVLSKYKNVKLFIPDVKVTLKPKPKKDLMLSLTIISTIVGVLGLIVASIALWIEM